MLKATHAYNLALYARKDSKKFLHVIGRIERDISAVAAYGHMRVTSVFPPLSDKIVCKVLARLRSSGYEAKAENSCMQTYFDINWGSSYGIKDPAAGSDAQA